uniref:histidine kinase n=1 Tax=Chlorobium phaeovibrioides (strain DSM 265 / 1930) TaxID=290318 RepID=A4SD96_CHLPM
MSLNPLKRKGMRHRALLMLAVLSLAAGCGARAWASPLELGKKEHYSLEGHLAVLEDPAGTVGLAEAKSAYRQGKFQEIEGKFAAGYSHSAYWVRFEILPGGGFPAKGWLRLAPAVLEHMEIYLPGNHGKPVRMGSTERHPEGILRNSDFVTPVELSGDGPIVVYLRIWSHNFITLHGGICTEAHLLSCTDHTIARESAFGAVSLMVILIALFVYRNTGWRHLLYFSIYIFILFLSMFLSRGMHFHLIPDWVRPFTAVLLKAQLGLSMFIFMLFVIELMNDDYPGRFRTYFTVLIVLAVLLLFSSPSSAFGVVASIVMTCYFSIVPLVVWFSSKIALPTRSSRVLFMAATVTIFSGFTVYFLHLMGIFPDNVFAFNALQASSLIYGLLLLPVFAIRIKSSRQQAIEQSILVTRNAEALSERIGRELREHSKRLEVSIQAERSASERMGKFLTMLAHDYRSPLSVIFGNLDILNRLAPEGNNEAGTEIAKIRHAAQRLEKLMEISLIHDRVQNPQEPGSKEIISLHEVLKSALSTAKTFWPERTFSLKDSSVDALLFGNPSQFDSALFNILDNAQSYSAPDSPVTITSSVLNGLIELSVSNTVSRFPGVDMEGLFEQYYRGTNASGTTGAGIGLAVTRSIIEQYGGEVTMTKTGELSITVTISIPVARNKEYKNNTE